MSLNSVTMSDNETMEPEDVGNHENFLVSMSKIGKSDGRFRLQHKNDETQVLSQPQRGDTRLAPTFLHSFSA